MTEYVNQLNELNELLNDLVEYSPSNSYLLQCLLKRYDAVIEQLYCMSNSKFQASVETIGILEQCISQIFSKTVSGNKKKSIYLTAKHILKTSIYIDLRNYKQHLLLDHIIYN
ncbi:hypothetical protein [Mucilaginibacter aquaedulcis]|uniref:hypothetical protein n=1 Tax=Mucilaginibacter aquaedulcis TaxID=1187081 RepID=UPI0025B5A846|nr:hypothetical protein [Mucilaginibacter aquaedulcis]MDN3551358.1 hypothetical protein [Mucilaginibacter aquaedulcis]